MAKVIIELDEGDLMELLGMVTEIKDSLIRIEDLLKDTKEKKNGGCRKHIPERSSICCYQYT